jgi:hypothetical protein
MFPPRGVVVVRESVPQRRLLLLYRTQTLLSSPRCRTPELRRVVDVHGIVGEEPQVPPPLEQSAAVVLDLNDQTFGGWLMGDGVPCLRIGSGGHD